MHSLRIISADKVNQIVDNRTVLSVLFQVLGEPVERAVTEEDRVVDDTMEIGEVRELPAVLLTARHGFPLGISTDDVIAELKKVIETYASDQASMEVSAKVEAEHAVADETIKNIVGQQIT